MSAAPGAAALGPPAAGPSRGRDAGGSALRRPAVEARLLACVHCGFCLPACPTYLELGDENDSPRGRVWLMRAFAEGRIGAGGALALHLGRCLGCRACESACPAGVEFGALLEAAREDLGAARQAGGRRLAGLVLRAVTGGVGSDLVFALARAVRAAIPRRAASRLPGRVGLGVRLLRATRPAAFRPAASHAAAPRPAGLERAATPADSAPGTRPTDPAPTAGPPGADAPTFALLEGCVMRGLFRHVHAATRRALRASGYEEAAAPGQRCCGALHAHAGEAAWARELARVNVAAFERCGARWIAVDAAGCGAALRDYPRWLEESPEWAARARRVADRVRDASELLVDPPRAVSGRLAGRVAYDAPCHLSHGQRVRAEPLRMLAVVEGLDATPLRSAERCCGGAGIWNLLEPGLSARIVGRKVEEVRSRRPDWVATGNPGCIMQIGAGLAAAGVDVPVVHPVELLDAALGGGSVPGARGRSEGSDRGTAGWGREGA